MDSQRNVLSLFEPAVELEGTAGSRAIFPLLKIRRK